ncbi:MAG: 50S ribosomal protein L22 [Anaeromyxobacteraceae bacterium]|jgi:large subunit ribosomal protein L22|nr:50S ribosomal protein L22 [Anaeromyxobacteraceae bacterium]
MAETETKKTVKKVRRAPPLPRSRKNRPAPPAAGPHASLNFLRLAPRKVRLVADTVRGLPVAAALAMLKYRPQAAAKPLAKLLLSAVANAENKGGKVDVDALVIKTLTVDQGPKMRRFMPRAMGRAYRVEKKTSHVYVELGTVGR